MAIVTVRAGATDTGECVVFYLNGIADLPFLARGVAGVPVDVPILAWVPPSAADAARLVTLGEVNEEHIRATPATARAALVGYSHGGLAALHAARRMAQLRDTEVRLVILDSVSYETFLRLPLDVEFCRSAPFHPPADGPLATGLRALQQELTSRVPTAADMTAAAALVARNADHIAALAAEFDPKLAGMDPADLVEKLADWLCYLLLIRGATPGPFTGSVDYVHSLEGRETALRFTGDEDHELAFWRGVAPRLERHHLGDRHWGLLTDDDVHKLIFRL